MAEYICREETVKAFCEKCQGYYDGHCIHRGECDIDVIKTAPAADVQPVRCGQWEDERYDDLLHCYIATCSECGYASTDLYRITDNHRHCEYCGAKMMKDGDTE